MQVSEFLDIFLLVKQLSKLFDKFGLWVIDDHPANQLLSLIAVDERIFNLLWNPTYSKTRLD